MYKHICCLTDSMHQDSRHSLASSSMSESPRVCKSDVSWEAVILLFNQERACFQIYIVVGIIADITVKCEHEHRQFLLFVGQKPPTFPYLLDLSNVVT